MAKSHAHSTAQRAVFRLFHLFGSPTRTIVFQRLAKRPMTAGELAKGLPLTRPAIVQHLKALEAARLVSARTEGKRRIYRIDSAGLGPLKEWLDRHHQLAQQTDDMHKK
jgi:DNA-binding transcriptional ArsR family regulator